ncbi:flagellar basal-body MS-ring/collar protein FliF [Virgibacillus kekensis]|uniref:Flagellar basal-body MS-ring/collar protein FliF n=1 Tax=Virgibacillus kekensis TaxID=202261 RepID=A0ABV9DGX6_9BACI
MKERLLKLKEDAKSFWTRRTKSQKGIFIGSIAIVAAIIAAVILFSSNSRLVPLYNDLSLQEVGQIKAELDARGITYEIDGGGKTILVPDTHVDSLLVDLASQGIPDTGNIDYSFFSENASWGITDNEFNMIKLDAMQTELATLIEGVDGINEAKVMINMPKEPVFVSETSQPASASIVLTTQPGYEFKGNQIDTLYRLVSKAVPNLPAENIVIMNQYFEYFDRNQQNGPGTQDVYTYQQNVKKDIERDIRRRLQQMIGAIVESPYKIRDLGIQVAVNEVKGRDGQEVQYLTAQEQDTVQAGIASILNSIINTSVDAEYGEVQPEDKISIVFQEFSESVGTPQPAAPVIPLWVYIAGGILLLLIIVLIVILLRNRKTTEEEFEESIPARPDPEIPEMPESNDSEAVVRRKQLEKMAKDKPEEFAKLLKSWISDD